MKTLKKILLRSALFILGLVITYIILAFSLTAITVNDTQNEENKSKTIYLSTNGVHLDIVLHRENLSPALAQDLYFLPNENYLAFGWGDKNFYLNTPTWGELTPKNALKAMFWKSESLMHVTRYYGKQSYWVAVPASEEQLQKVNVLLLESFTHAAGKKLRLNGAGYYDTDDFYQAEGSYSCIKTCNTWANTIFKESGLKACAWTPFDFGLMGKY